MILRRREKQVGCDFNNPSQFGLCMRILERSIKRTGDDVNYFDVDEFTLADTRGQLTALLALKIQILQKLLLEQAGPEQFSGKMFNKIALIEKRDGSPVGLVTHQGSLAVELKMKKTPIILRPSRRSLRSKIAGGVRLTDEDNVLIVDTVTGTGWTISNAAQIVWDLDARVAGALVLVDRCWGAVESLAARDIALHSIISFEKVLGNDSAVQWLAEKGIALQVPERKTILEFGSGS